MCNRSNEEVQQILLSQLSDDEVEIVFLHLDQFNEAYNEITDESYFLSNDRNNNDTSLVDTEKVNLVDKQQNQQHHYKQDLFDTFADMNKPGYQRTASPHQTMASNNSKVGGGRHHYSTSEALKGSIRRKISLSSIAHMWSTSK